MTDWKASRFWDVARTVNSGNGFTIHLDGHPVRTPAKAPMVLPTAAMAQAVAEEWNAQGQVIDPETMPVTKSANSAIDNVSHRVSEVAEMLAAYADTDLTCYRAVEPEGLVKRQNSAWDPLLGWVSERFGVRLFPVEGVIHRPQPFGTLKALRAPLDAMTPFELTAMYDLVSISGSLVIGLAVNDGHRSPDSLWISSRIDEDWQVERWGEDVEASHEASRKRLAFLQAAIFLALARR